MRTKELIEKSGLDRETLRFYEKKGIIDDPSRTESGYRQYPQSVLDRLHFVTTAKVAGFTLSEIKELLDFKTSGVSCRDGRDIALSKISEVDEKMKSLKKMKKILNKFVEACESEGEKGLKKKCHLSFDLMCCR